MSSPACGLLTVENLHVMSNKGLAIFNLTCCQKVSKIRYRVSATLVALSSLLLSVFGLNQTFTNFRRFATAIDSKCIDMALTTKRRTSIGLNLSQRQQRSMPAHQTRHISTVPNVKSRLHPFGKQDNRPVSDKTIDASSSSSE